MKHTTRIPQNEQMSAEEIEAFNRLTPTMPWLYEPILEAIRSISGKIRSVLDVGCGNGYLLGKIHGEFPEWKLSGIDSDPRMIRLAQENHLFDFRVDDAHNWKKEADLSISNLALHHFSKPQLALSQTGARGRIGSVISDQVRPAMEDELEDRLKRRKWFFRQTPDYYSGDQERSSILAAFSRKEIIDLFASTTFKLTFVDHDYYERFVAIDDGTLDLASLEDEHQALEMLIEERNKLVHAKHTEMKRLTDECEKHHRDNKDTYSRKKGIEWRMEKHYRNYIDQETLDNAIAVARRKFGNCMDWFPHLQEVRNAFNFQEWHEIVSRPKPYLCLLPVKQYEWQRKGHWQPVVVENEAAALESMDTWHGWDHHPLDPREGWITGFPICYQPDSPGNSE